MRRSLLIILVACLLTQSFCYLNNTDKSRVRIPLIPPDPLVTALHVAVYNGSPEDLLLYQVFQPDTFVDLEVPSGPDRIFVIWAETTPGIAKYYGQSNPVDVGGDNDEEVMLSMRQFGTVVSVFNLDYSSDYQKLTWKSIYGASLYEILKDNGNSFYYFDAYSTGTSFSPAIGPNYKIKAHSSLFNLVSEMSPISL